MTWVNDGRIKKFAALMISYAILIAALRIFKFSGTAGVITVAVAYALAVLFVMHFTKDKYPEGAEGEYEARCGENICEHCGTYGKAYCKCGILIRVKKYIGRNRLRRIIASAMAFAAVLGVSVLISAVTVGKNIPVDNFSFEGKTPFFAFLSASALIFRHVLVPALCEEIYFRKVFIFTLTDGCGRSFLFSAVLSSMLFAAMHGAGVAPAVFAFVSGLLLSFLIYVTDSVTYCCAVHFTYNLIALIAAVI